MIIVHASLSRLSTVPTPPRDTTDIWAFIAFSPYITKKVLRTLSPSCFAVCHHHLSPISTMAIVFSLLPSVPTSPCCIRLFSSSLTHPVPPWTSHTLPLCEFYSIALPQGHICVSSSSSSRLLVYLFFLEVSGPIPEITASTFRVVHWAVQLRFHSDLFYLHPAYLKVFLFHLTRYFLAQKGEGSTPDEQQRHTTWGNRIGKDPQMYTFDM